ncbi:MAG: hypothetical protein ABI137_16005 [Antricoccus sp.]
MRRTDVDAECGVAFVDSAGVWVDDGAGWLGAFPGKDVGDDALLAQLTTLVVDSQY